MHPSSSLPILSESDAALIVREPVFSVAPLGQGNRSRVYRVETEEGIVRVVRLTPRNSGRVQREAWVRQQLRGNSLVPTLTELHVQGVPLAHQVDVVSMAELPGATLFEALRSSFESEASALYRQFGAGLAAMHTVPTQGYGLLDPGGRGPFASWREAIAATARAAREEARISPLSDLVDRATEAIERAIAQLPEVQPRLIHGDAQPMNVQVHRGRIVAFFDFEFASGADPFYELAYVEPLFEPSFLQTLPESDRLARREAFYEGYVSAGGMRPADDDPRMPFYRLVHALRGTEFLSVVGPQLAAPQREGHTITMRAQLERWLG